MDPTLLFPREQDTGFPMKPLPRPVEPRREPHTSFIGKYTIFPIYPASKTRKRFTGNAVSAPLSDNRLTMASPPTGQ